MILDTEVTIVWTKDNRKRYEEMGYRFTGYMHYLKIPLPDLHTNSSTKVKVKCDRCDYKTEVTYGSLFKRKASELGYGSYLCKDCIFKAFPLDRRKPVKEEKRVAYAEWHNNVEISVPKEHLKVDLTIENNYTVIPEMSGIYKFYDDHDELLYLGKAKNLRARISSHIKNKSNTAQFSHLFKTVSCSYFEYKNIDELEIYLINQLKPKHNVKDVYTYQSTAI